MSEAQPSAPDRQKAGEENRQAASALALAAQLNAVGAAECARSLCRGVDVVVIVNVVFNTCDQIWYSLTFARSVLRDAVMIVGQVVKPAK